MPLETERGVYADRSHWGVREPEASDELGWPCPVPEEWLLRDPGRYRLTSCPSTRACLTVATRSKAKAYGCGICPLAIGHKLEVPAEYQALIPKPPPRPPKPKPVTLSPPPSRPAPAPPRPAPSLDPAPEPAPVQTSARPLRRKRPRKTPRRRRETRPGLTWTLIVESVRFDGQALRLVPWEA